MAFDVTAMTKEAARLAIQRIRAKGKISRTVVESQGSSLKVSTVEEDAPVDVDFIESIVGATIEVVLKHLRQGQHVVVDLAMAGGAARSHGHIE